MPQASPIWTPQPRSLAPWATRAAESRGRCFDEPPCPMRTPFQRDRDRIVHATAFRRLNYKTQAFLLHEGDHYRNRLTHTLEVAQIARSIARQLGLDEDLAEALALAHDLGHPPFGHAGERALDRAMQAQGGFDHNAQSLRVVTRLERKYRAFDGLNLAIETLDGLVKHNGPIDPASQPVLMAAIDDAGIADRTEVTHQGAGEAQAAAVADDIAYYNHDIDDALRAGLLEFKALADVPLIGRFVREVSTWDGNGDLRRAFYEVNRRMITAMVADVVAAARDRIAVSGCTSAMDVCRQALPLVAFSPVMADELAALRKFLFAEVYWSEHLMRPMRNAEVIVSDLFTLYSADLATLPPGRASAIERLDGRGRARGICDFIAGMTDRFAVAEHRRLFDATPDLG